MRKKSFKKLKLVLDTNNKISKKPIKEMTPTLRKRVDKTLRSIYTALEKEKLTTLKDGSGNRAYDGMGFDYRNRTFDFFWYFANNLYGNRQLIKAFSKVVDLSEADKLVIKDFEVTVVVE